VSWREEPGPAVAEPVRGRLGGRNGFRRRCRIDRAAGCGGPSSGDRIARGDRGAPSPGNGCPRPGWSHWYSWPSALTSCTWGDDVLRHSRTCVLKRAREGWRRSGAGLVSLALVRYADRDTLQLAPSLPTLEPNCLRAPASLSPPTTECSRFVFTHSLR